jgi:mycoredoxin-dependent peroxiredoxin
MVDVGDVAPDFALKDQDRQEVRLSGFRGRKNVVLVFYPFSFSGICTGELCEIRDDLPEWVGDDVQTLAVSVDCLQVHAGWAKQEGYSFPLLADYWPHGEAARAYGVFSEEVGCALRATFVIDKQGVVTYKVVNGIGDARDHTEARKALAALA